MAGMKIIECPRDAMQGIRQFIPTQVKIDYLNCLLQVGFHTLDFGSFVSPKAIPQMKDTSELVDALDLSTTSTRLLAIVANTRGAEAASEFGQISYLGFPLSLSETFQLRNTNRGIEEAWKTIEQIQSLCLKKDKELVVYLSMGFGNPYGDPYSVEIVHQSMERLMDYGIKIVSLADTVGKAQADEIQHLCEAVSRQYPDLEIGVHLHADRDSTLSKIEAAYKGGIRRFDAAINGFGGCPMADDQLVGNVATEVLLDYFNSNCIDVNYDKERFQIALNKAPGVFNL